MIVRSLEVCGFRNLKDGVFRPVPGVNVLFGDNAQGKTNLIEAIWLCTGAKSFRGARDAELVAFGQKRSSISLEYTSANEEKTISISIDSTRRASLNGVPLDAPSGLAGEFCSVIFSPEHLGLVKDGPFARRRFIDAAICQLKPRHAAEVAEYRHALLQRNALLKDIPFHSELMDTLEVWDEKLALIGASIVVTRLRYLKKLEEAAAAIYRRIAGEGEALNIEYVSGEQEGLQLEGPRNEVCGRLKNSLLSKFSQQRGIDISGGYTHAGPHRDDLLLKINGISARSFGSQGQQRTAALALKLAEAAVLSDAAGQPPVLLLDDVLSELDHSRQDYLLGSIKDMQVFITCCDPRIHRGLSIGSRGGLFRIRAGGIEPL